MNHSQYRSVFRQFWSCEHFTSASSFDTSFWHIFRHSYLWFCASRLEFHGHIARAHASTGNNGCDLNPGPSAPESSTLTTRLPSHPVLVYSVGTGSIRLFALEVNIRVHLSSSISPYIGWPKKLYIFQHTISLQPFKIKRNGFHWNIHRVSGIKDYVVIFCVALKYFFVN